MLQCLSFENGDVTQLPYPGGVLNQPFRTFQVFRIVRRELIKHISKNRGK